MRWHECGTHVRFHEVDSFNVVWHGHYLKYFEMGRLALSEKFGLSVGDLKAMGYVAPVVELGCRFRGPARYGDEIIIRTHVAPTDRALLTFRYTVARGSGEPILAEGHTSHVLLTEAGTMLYEIPSEIAQAVGKMISFCNG